MVPVADDVVTAADGHINAACGEYLAARRSYDCDALLAMCHATHLCRFTTGRIGMGARGLLQSAYSFKGVSEPYEIG